MDTWGTDTTTELVRSNCLLSKKATQFPVDFYNDGTKGS